MKRPRIITNCVANKYANRNERIVEYSFSNGKGGLIAFSLDDQGRPRVELYRHDPEVVIVTPKGGVA